ncbi:MAG: hypothetical protein JRG95_21935, partial [Deltaproteobacteria bacterium]|nr:hypothetical protein [Deltaproteobacteria bacterium]
MVFDRPLRAARFTALVAVLSFAGVISAAAAPIIQESGWSLVRTVSINNPNSATYNPVDGLLYVAVTTSEATDGGLYRINADGTNTKVAAGERPVGVVVDPSTGNVFYAEPGFPGAIYRHVLGTSGPGELWVSGFHSGDDDTIGLAFAPSNYTGAHLLPGQAVVVDEGTGGPDELWGWNFGTSQGEFAIHQDNGTSPLVQGVDVAVSSTDIWIADVDGQAIWQVTAAGGLVQLATSVALGAVAAITVDPITGDLVVMDKTSDEVLRIDPYTGAVSVMFSGFSFID